MHQKKITFFAYTLFIICLFLNYSAFTMDPADEIFLIRAPSPPLWKEPEEKKKPKKLIENEIVKLRDINSFIEDPKHEVRKEFNNFFKKQYTKSDAILAPEKTGVIIFYNYKNPASKNWNDPYVFFKYLDEKFFLPVVSKKTRFLQIIGLTSGAAVPWSIGPTVLYLAGNILQGVPIAGTFAYGMVFTAIGFTTLPFAYQGWEIGGQIGNTLFDHNGFTPTKDGSKFPHIQKDERPLCSRGFSLFSGIVRTLPFATLFLKAEMPVNSDYGYGLTGPLAIALLGRTYDYSMKFWWRLGHSQINENSTMLNLKKKILIDSLLKTKKKVSESDEFVDLLFLHLKKGITALTLEKSKKTEFHNKLAQKFENIEEEHLHYNSINNSTHKTQIFESIKNKFSFNLVDIVYEYISKELTEREFNISLQEMKRKIEKNIKIIVSKKMKKSDPFKSEIKQNIIEEIDDFVHKEIRKIKLRFSISDKKILFPKLQKGLKNFFFIADGILNEDGGSLFDMVFDYIEKDTNTTVTAATQQKIISSIRNIIFKSFSDMLKNKIILERDTPFRAEEANKISKRLLEKITKSTGSQKDILQGLLEVINEYIKSKFSTESQSIERSKKIISRTIEGFKNPQETQSLVNEIYGHLEYILGRVTLDNYLKVSERDTSVSLFSLLLIKDEQLFDVSVLKDDLKEATKDVDAAFSLASYGSATELPLITTARKEIAPGPPPSRLSPFNAAALDKMKRAAENMATHPIEKFSTLIDHIQKISPQSPAKKLLEKLAILLQGAAAPGRTLITYWAVNEILTHYAGANPDVAFYTGIGAGLVDVLCRTVQEWYLQQSAFSSLRGFGSRANDYWPLRWATSFISTVSSAFINLATVGILFDLFEDHPPYIKFLITIATYPSEYASFFQFFQEKLAGLIRAGSHLLSTCIQTTTQKRAWINDILESAMKDVFQFDETTIGEIYSNSQGGI